MNVHRPLRTIVASWLAVALVAAPGCGENPATGKRQLSLISEEEEIALGRSAADEAMRSLGVVADEALQAYVQDLGEKLAAASERPRLPWSFRVVDDPTPNAFALPGGYIFVTRGLLGLLTSEAQLASVLGHEIAHVTARHSASQISKAQIAQFGLGLGALVFPELRDLQGVASAGLQLLFLKHGRDAERQADELGFRYALGQRYDVREMREVFEVLQSAGESAGRSPVPGWLTTHPSEPERIAAVEARIAAVADELQRARVGRAEYLERIDGLVFGDNPRNGFLRGDAFYHPELRFRFDLPPGWRTENLTSAVTSVSPSRDAALQLTIAGNLQAEDAARQFLEQPGVSGASESQSFNGIDAVVSAFEAQARQGVMQGFAAFLEHGGTTYQLLGYAPSPVFARYRDALRRAIGSFAPLADPAILATQPQRIDIVRLAAPASLADFARRERSAMPLEQLALINQIEDADAPLAAGTLLKRVVR
jgi:predicted Zn-dependent protease